MIFENKRFNLENQNIAASYGILRVCQNICHGSNFPLAQSWDKGDEGTTLSRLIGPVLGSFPSEVFEMNTYLSLE